VRCSLMAHDPIVITREALYEQVWSEPISKIASRIEAWRSCVLDTTSPCRRVAGGPRGSTGTTWRGLRCLLMVASKQSRSTSHLRQRRRLPQTFQKTSRSSLVPRTASSCPSWNKARVTSVRYLRSALLVAGLCAVASAQEVRPGTIGAAPQDRFSTVNGVRLQYVDWGGTGRAILLLPGLGDNVHRFDEFAPRFTDAFHVVGFSRRGQGESDKPPSPYDTETLAEDVYQFLKTLNIDVADVLGHSIAGVEMTRFAQQHPRSVRHLVYLDAAYDMGSAYEAALSAKLIPPAKAPATPIEFIDAEARQTHLDFRTIRAPALAFFVINRPEAAGKWYEPFELGYKGEQIKKFERDLKRRTTVVFRDNDHFFFNDPKKVDDVVATIRQFLARP
jgi:pimeloyl-ACP methyl ester carboxylesterase